MPASVGIATSGSGPVRRRSLATRDEPLPRMCGADTVIRTTRRQAVFSHTPNINLSRAPGRGSSTGDGDRGSASGLEKQQWI